MDFRNGNIDVIKKYLKTHDINPIDLDIEEEVQYKAKDYSVSASEIEFDDMVSELKTSPTFDTTVKVMTEVWDAKSKEQLFNKPALMRGLQDEIEMGRYEEVQGIIDQRKLLGNTNGKSDIDMYIEVVSEMDKQSKSQTKETTQPKTEKKTEVVKKKADTSEKKKASIQSKKRPKAKETYDPTTLSDDEFEKLMADGAIFKT